MDKARQALSGQSARIAVAPATLAPLTRANAGELPTSRDLLVQALLYLPRLAHADGTVSFSDATDEIERLRTLRAYELAPLRALAAAPERDIDLDDLDVCVVDEAAALPILEHFHYLCSPREEGITVGAVYQGRIAALCTVSPLDLPHVSEVLPVAHEEAAVVSRVFAFDWAPRNTISYMLARAVRAGGVSDEVRMLLTYLNPNLGFSGSSYKAANWMPFGVETGTRYAYLNERYITDRVLLHLSVEAHAFVEYSQMPLAPLTLLCLIRDKLLRHRHPNGFELVVERPATVAPS